MYGGSAYRLINTTEKASKKFGIKETIREFEFNENFESANFVQANRLFQKFINDIHKDYIADIPNTKKIRLCINHEKFAAAINMPFMYPRDLTQDLIWENLERVIQSRKRVIPEDQDLTVHSIKISIMEGNLLRGSSKKIHYGEKV